MLGRVDERKSEAKRCLDGPSTALRMASISGHEIAHLTAAVAQMTGPMRGGAALPKRDSAEVP